MAITKHSSLLTLSLKGASPLPQKFAGRYFVYVEGTGPLIVRLDEERAGLLLPGQALYAGDDQSFDGFDIQSPSGADMTVQVWVGFTDLIDRRRNQIEAATEWVPVADVAGVFVAGALLPGQSLDLPGTPTLARIRRKAVVVANLDPAVNLLLTNAANVVGGIVRPGESIAHPVSGFLRIRNTTGAAIACTIAEIWWQP